MWGESSKSCENNCQCSGLITENFKIDSGNNATKRKQETALTINFKQKMNPHSLDFSSPQPTPSKRRILGDIQNFALSPVNLNMDRLSSPNLERLKNSPMEVHSPGKSPMIISPLASLASPLMNSPIIATHSPLTTRIKRTSKISKIFEERTKFKMDKENFSNFKESFSFKEASFTTENFKTESFKESFTTESFATKSFTTESFSMDSYKTESYKEESYKEEFLKFDLEETARDFSFGERFQASRERTQTWSSTKLDFRNALSGAGAVPAPSLDDLALADLEAELAGEHPEPCQYEIISTDSPNVISRGRSTTRKVSGRFSFGAPLTDSEPSTSFSRHATRMLNFDEDFEFTSPAAKSVSAAKLVSAAKSVKSVSVKKALKFDGDRSVTPTRALPLRHERSDSSIGSMSSTSSPKLSRIFTSESTTSMESGFISEMEEPFLELEESNSPKIANFNELLSGRIRENAIPERVARRPLARSLSFHPEARTLISILESPSEKRKIEDDEAFSQENKRRRSDCEPQPRERARPVLQRALSENNATIKSALARSSTEADLIGDYSGAHALPLAAGDHADLKSVSADTLAALLRGEYRDSVPNYQIIDCRYPYEYEGGHIASAVNVFTAEQARELVTAAGAGRTVLVLHCEFSIERGPKLSRTLRSLDRAHNRARYPALAFPEIYLLHGGYRAFHAAHPDLCTPMGYTAMLDPRHKHLLKRHRSQGKNRLLL